MKLEYVILFEDSGIPIYSHCFGGFCANVGLDENLLSGFLSALTSMPQALGQSESLQSVEMDYTKLLFSNTESGKTIVIGVDKEFYDDESEKKIKELFDKISVLVEEEYGDINWQTPSKDIRYNFEHELVDDVIAGTLDVFVDYCRAGDDCMFDIETSKDEDAGLTDDMSIWDRFKQRYSYVKETSHGFLKYLLRPIIKFFRWKDRRDYSKKTDDPTTS